MYGATAWLSYERFVAEYHWCFETMHLAGIDHDCDLGLAREAAAPAVVTELTATNALGIKMRQHSIKKVADAARAAEAKRIADASEAERIKAAKDAKIIADANEALRIKQEAAAEKLRKEVAAEEERKKVAAEKLRKEKADEVKKN